MDLGFVRIFKIMLLQARMPVTEYVILSQIAKECKTCMAQGRTAQASGKRMVMQELSVNSVLKELGRAYSVDNQGLGDSYQVLCPLKFRRSLPRIASYAGALAPNFRRLVPGKPPYPGAWPLNFRGYCPESYPK
jgi:hypothetical protein